MKNCPKCKGIREDVIKKSFVDAYVLLCENNNDDGEIYNNLVCGISIADWVAMACETKPVFLNISKDDNILDIIRPYANQREYIVALYANTPLITKTHLRDLIGYVQRKRFNVCNCRTALRPSTKQTAAKC